MREDCEQAFDDFAQSQDRSVGFKWRWTFDKIHQDVAIVSQVDNAVGGKGYDPSWSVRTKSLVSILRDERYKLERARMQAITNGRRSTNSE